MKELIKDFKYKMAARAMSFLVKEGLEVAIRQPNTKNWTVFHKDTEVNHAR